MSPAERKQLKQNLKMFAQAREYLTGKGLLYIYSDEYQLSDSVFNELFQNQFKKKTAFNNEYDKYEGTIYGHKFFTLIEK